MRAFFEAPDGQRQRLAATVAALRSPTSYPGSVREVEAIETHMSWVFLTEAHAYKLKKPIRTPNLDYTTVQARRRACDTELQLNRRLAASVYLAVVPLVAPDGSLRVESAGTPIDWLVKMRRLPRDRMLDACIERRETRGEDVERLAEILVRFYGSADKNPLPAALYRDNIVADIESKAESLDQPHYGLERADIQAVLEGQKRWLEEHGALLEARASTIVDAHGDLRPEHVCLEDPPVVIDCLEFSRDLRLLDPVAELSFLALECRRLGAGWIGEQLFDGYARRSEDHAAAALVPFYQSHHALIRAAIAVWHLDDDAIERTDSWPQRATWYLRTARQLL